MRSTKLKVVWICHFTNDEIHRIVKPRKYVPEFAPWISNTIPVFENRDDVQLHIISPHRYISGLKRFELRGVKYYFYNPGIPLWGRHWPGFFKWDTLTNYWYTKKIVRVLTNSLKPDIIHLQGAENPYYSAAILQFLGKLPVLVNLQRMNLDFYFGESHEAKLRESIEKRILSDFGDFSIRTDAMAKDLLTFNPEADTYWVRYKMPSIRPIECSKEYDIVFFARVSPNKGIEDLLMASSLAALKLGHLKLCIIGGVEETYKQHLISKYEDPNLTLVWKGMLPTLDEVHTEASKAHISVLPTHQDIIPGTIIESILLGLPVVSYSVGSIPELNSENEAVLLATKGDIESLAAHMIRLLSEPIFAAQLAENALRTVNSRYNGDNILEEHLACYRAVILKFNKRDNDLTSGVK